ncbi:MAG: glycosyltransferase [Phycisphaeraceae bacterium]
MASKKKKSSYTSRSTKSTKKKNTKKTAAKAVKSKANPSAKAAKPANKTTKKTAAAIPTKATTTTKKKRSTKSRTKVKAQAKTKSTAPTPKKPPTQKVTEPVEPTPLSGAPEHKPDRERDPAPPLTPAPPPKAAPPPLPDPEPTPVEPDGDLPPQPKRAEPILLEVGWEVCNKLGGIYTVLRTKVPSMMARWGKRYCLIGPYNHDTAQVEFEPAGPDQMDTPIGRAVQQMREMGYGVEYGHWLVTGRPQVVLMHVGDAKRYLGDIKYRLWADHRIPTPDGDALADDVVAFGEAVRMFLFVLGQQQGDKRDLVAHFHEWMAGVCIPMLRQEQWPGSIVFTTHATLLGRYLAMHNPVFYDHLSFFDPAHEAKHFNIEFQHGVERAAAHGSHVFTTVSDVTAMECRHLLGRDPDVLLPNGLNIQRFAALHEFQNLHAKYKQRIHEFTMAHFFPSYTFDLDNTLYFFTSGRYEYRNKGMDLCIESLARLNHRLKITESNKTVVFFIITRAPVRSINVGELQSVANLEDFRRIAEHMTEQMEDRIVEHAAKGQVPDLNALVDEYWRLRLRRSIHAWKRNWLPPIVTHDLQDDAKDDVLEKLRACHLLNHEEDRVKVVFHPDFINPVSPLWGLEYDDFVRGTHMGVFPSYYEPWGYTPLESIALGVPAITSDLSGFGSYLAQLLPDHEQKGLFCVNRRYTGYHEAADQLTDIMFRYTELGRRERINLRNTVESFSEQFDWHNLGRRYNEAHEIALDRV